MSRNPRTSRGVLILVVVIFTLLAIVGGFQLTQILQTAGTPTRSTGEVRMSMYSQIQTGMELPEVVRILGRPGTELSRTQMAGYTTVMYSWTNSDGSNMNVMLQNDRVISKAQFGLK